MIVYHCGEHNHDSDILKSLVLEKRQEVVANAVQNETISPRTAFMDLTNKVMSDPNVGPSGLLHLLTPRSLSMAILRKRKAEGNLPDLPKNWEDMIVPDQYKATIDGELFLILEEIVPDTLKKVWGFASPSGLATLKQAQDIYGDGTFKLVKQCLFE